MQYYYKSCGKISILSQRYYDFFSSMMMKQKNAYYEIITKDD
jgi:hypothetical protein